jgi:hypothetical protein
MRGCGRGEQLSSARGCGRGDGISSATATGRASAARPLVGGSVGVVDTLDEEARRLTTIVRPGVRGGAESAPLSAHVIVPPPVEKPPGVTPPGVPGTHPGEGCIMVCTAAYCARGPSIDIPEAPVGGPAGTGLGAPMACGVLASAHCAREGGGWSEGDVGYGCSGTASDWRPPRPPPGSHQWAAFSAFSPRCVHWLACWVVQSPTVAVIRWRTTYSSERACCHVRKVATEDRTRSVSSAAVTTLSHSDTQSGTAARREASAESDGWSMGGNICYVRWAVAHLRAQVA